MVVVVRAASSSTFVASTLLLLRSRMNGALDGDSSQWESMVMEVLWGKKRKQTNKEKKGKSEK